MLLEQDDRRMKASRQRRGEQLRAMGRRGRRRVDGGDEIMIPAVGGRCLCESRRCRWLEQLVI